MTDSFSRMHLSVPELINNSEANEDSILLPIRAALTEATGFISGGNMGPHTRHLEELKATYTPYARNYLTGGVSQAGFRLLDSITSVVFQRSCMIAPEEVVSDLFDRHITGAINSDDAAFLQIRALASVEKVCLLRDFTDRVIPKIDNETLGQQFKLMKLLSRKGTQADSSIADREIEALQVLYVFNILDDENAASSMPVVDKLKGGEFDTLIGQEIMLNASQNQDSPQNGEVELVKLLKLCNQLSGKSLPEAIADLVDVKNLIFWPDSCKKSLDLRRGQYRLNLDTVYSYTKDLLKSYDCIVVRDRTEEDVHQAATDYNIELARQKAVDTSLAITQRLAARVIVEADKKRKRSYNEQTKTIGSTATNAASPEAQPTTPRKLAYITPSGEEASEGSPAYKALFADYLTSHKSQAGLIEDLETIRGYLKTIDLSSGLPRGIYKLRGVPLAGLLRGERRIPKIYQLKPAEAIGLPTQSEEGDKLRVLFTMRGDTIGLLGIETKANIATLERNLGIKGRNNRK